MANTRQDKAQTDKYNKPLLCLRTLHRQTLDMTNPRKTNAIYDKPQTNKHQTEQTLDIRHNKSYTQQTLMMFDVYEGTRHGKLKTEKHQTGQSLDKHNKLQTQDITKARNDKLLLCFRTLEGTLNTVYTLQQT